MDGGGVCRGGGGGGNVEVGGRGGSRLYCGI